MNEQSMPTGKKLLASTVVALAAAGVLLITAVLPAEYGIDPIGVGSALGIKGMSAATEDDETATVAPVADAEPAPSEITLSTSADAAVSAALWTHTSPYRSDELSLTLAPNEGAEIKASMKTGERFVFSWQASGGLVNFDMHGEVVGAKANEYTSHLKGRSTADSHGAFVAPFDGTHGWYWRNRGTQPVTVTVKTSGFYEKLYRP
jgi:hypothetical protein